MIGPQHRFVFADSSPRILHVIYTPRPNITTSSEVNVRCWLRILSSYLARLLLRSLVRPQRLPLRLVLTLQLPNRQYGFGPPHRLDWHKVRDWLLLRVGSSVRRLGELARRRVDNLRLLA